MQNYTRNVWRRCENYTRIEWRRCKTTLETGGENQETFNYSGAQASGVRSPSNVRKKFGWKLHFKRVEKMWKPTRNQWRRLKTTLETCGEDVKTTLETSGEDKKTHSKLTVFFTWAQASGITTVPPMWARGSAENYTRNEWRRCENPLETGREDV